MSQQHLFRRVLYTWISDNLCDEFVRPMKDMTFEQLDELAASFKFDKCVQREELIRIMQDTGL